MDGRTDRGRVRQTDRQRDTRKDGLPDGGMNRQTKGQTEVVKKGVFLVIPVRLSGIEG